jgi:hypothetical protein
MSRISNTGAYANINPTLTDYFVLTDNENNLATKTCTVQSLQALFGLTDTVITVPISSVLLNALPTQPVTLIASPGSGYILNVLSIVVFVDPGNIAYGFDNQASLFVGTYNAGNILNTTFNSATDIVTPLQPATGLNIPENQPLVLSSIASTSGSGNGVAYIKINYRTLKLDSTF